MSSFSDTQQSCLVRKTGGCCNPPNGNIFSHAIFMVIPVAVSWDVKLLAVEQVYLSVTCMRSMPSTACFRDYQVQQMDSFCVDSNSHTNH